MIRSVQIVNWKGHDELRLSFSEGVNFLVGPNGIGKTSVLDAICFALLGDISATSIYRQLTYKDLIRDPRQDMEIVLTIAPQGEELYTLTRAHTARTDRKRCSLSRDGSILTKSWDQVTARTLELLDADDLFLRRVILLSEGDTFDYATQPPGEALTKHIEQVLGINRMEDLRNSLSELRRQFEREAQRWRGEIEAARQSARRDRANLDEISAQLEALKEERDTISERIAASNRQIGATVSQTRVVKQRIERVDSLLEEWRRSFGEIPTHYQFSSAIGKIEESYHRERSNVSEQRDRLQHELTWLSAQIDSQETIIKLVDPLEKEHREVACPVCKRPLSVEMMREIRDECQRILADLARRKKETSGQLPVIDEKVKEITSLLEKLQGIQTTVLLLEREEPHTLSVPTLESHLAHLEDHLHSREEELDQLKAQRTDLDQRIQLVHTELSDLRERIDEQHMLEKRRSLASATKGEFVAQLVQESLEAAMDRQRRVSLEPLTEELSSMWTAFMGRKVEVTLKDNASVGIVDHQAGTTFEFPQLSGGEKTALLIFTQIMLSKYFSNADFMLIDEPLEHLDARNRWALIKFLVDSTRAGYPKQLIVTTIEEPLIREYLDEQNVSVSILSKESPILQSS